MDIQKYLHQAAIKEIIKPDSTNRTILMYDEDMIDYVDMLYGVPVSNHRYIYRVYLQPFRLVFVENEELRNKQLSFSYFNLRAVYKNAIF